MKRSQSEDVRAYQKAYYQANKEKLKAAVKARRDADLEADRAKQRARRAANPERFKEYERVKLERHGKEINARNRERASEKRAAGIPRKRSPNERPRAREKAAEQRALGTRKVDPAKARMYANNRRSAKLNATPLWVDWDKVSTIYEECAAISIATGIPHEVDHIVPLKGRNVCGLHVHYNLQILTREANRCKFNNMSECDSGHLDTGRPPTGGENYPHAEAVQRVSMGMAA